MKALLLTTALLLSELPAFAAEIGDPAPDFTLREVRGQTVSLRRLQGKIILLDFGTTWCGTCKEAIPRLSALYRRFHERGLVVLGINVMDGWEKRNAARLPGFIEREGINYPVLIDETMSVYESYDGRRYPHFVLIGRDGRILSNNDHDFSEIEAWIWKTLGPRPAPR